VVKFRDARGTGLLLYGDAMDEVRAEGASFAGRPVAATAHRDLVEIRLGTVQPPGPLDLPLLDGTVLRLDLI
jgi:hypothetical protein